MKLIVDTHEIGNFSKMHHFSQLWQFNETKEEIPNSVHNKSYIFIGYSSGIDGVLWNRDAITIRKIYWMVCFIPNGQILNFGGIGVLCNMIGYKQYNTG